MRRKKPQYTLDEEDLLKETCRHLITNHLPTTRISLVIDDEKHFGFSNNYKNYFMEDRNTPGQLLAVYLVFSDRGRSEPLIRAQVPGRVKAATYLDQCIKNRILPFIREYHSNGQYVFWPDYKSPAHYSRAINQWAVSNGLKMVPYEHNPTNVPQARWPMKIFWRELYAKVYGDNWTCRTREQLTARILEKLGEVRPSIVHHMIERVRQNLRIIAEFGPLHRSLFY